MLVDEHDDRAAVVAVVSHLVCAQLIEICRIHLHAFGVSRQPAQLQSFARHPDRFRPVAHLRERDAEAPERTRSPVIDGGPAGPVHGLQRRAQNRHGLGRLPVVGQLIGTLTVVLPLHDRVVTTLGRDQVIQRRVACLLEYSRDRHEGVDIALERRWIGADRVGRLRPRPELRTNGLAVVVDQAHQAGIILPLEAAQQRCQEIVGIGCRTASAKPVGESHGARDSRQDDDI